MAVKTTGHHALIYTLIILVVFVVVVWTAPKPTYAPRGIALPLSHTLPKATVGVMLYEAQPMLSQGLALIRVEKYAAGPTEAGQAVTLAYAEELARQSGANGLVIQQFGYAQGSGVESAISMYLLHGVAIHVLGGDPKKIPLEPSIVLPNQ